MKAYDREYYEGGKSNYGAFGGYGSRLFDVSRFLVRRKVFSIIGKRKAGGSHIDLGCAYGYLADSFRRKGFRSVGVDVSGYAVTEARKRFPRLDVREMDIEKGIGFPDGCFDVVTAMDVLEHCRNLEWTLKEIGRVMKGDGILLLSVPDSDMFPEEKDVDDTHVWRMNMNQWVVVFEKNGFDVMGRWVFPSWLKRIVPHWCVSMVLLRKAAS